MDYRDETENNQVLDRGKVRILLCDNDSKSCDEVFSLLCKCSYQVTSARSARQLIYTLNAEGPNIDIILSEVDLPISKGFKMLKYITRQKESQRIPVIMMSVQDEVSVVVKCLNLGAVDYLVKPLRTNELLNLWTHVWRRRKTLGLVEKNIFSCDLVGSDPSDANTNSTAIFSDDTDDKSYWNPLPDMNVSTYREGESNAGTSVNASVQNSWDRNVPNATDQRVGRILSHPKKSELKIGEFSAFFTYVKSSIPIGNLQTVVSMDESVTKSEQPGRGDELLMYSKSSFVAINHQRVVNMDEAVTESGKPNKETALLPSWGEQVGNHLNRHEHGKGSDIFSYQVDVGTSSTSFECLQRRNSKEKEKKFPAAVLSHRSSSPSEFPCRSSQEKDEQFSTTVLLHQGSGSSEFPCRRNSEEKDEEFSTTVLLHQSGPSFEFPQRRSSKDKEEQVSATVLSQQSNSSQLEVSAVSTFPPFPYYFPGMNQAMMPPPSSTQLYQGTYPHDLARHPPSSMFPHYSPFSQCHPPYPSMMSSFPAYYPIQLNMQQGQMPAIHVWHPPMSNSPSAEVKQSPVDKREAALIKFRQKKKDRCFDKKIRFANRKTLAERRARVRGQFVRQVNGVDVGQPATPVDDSYDDVEDDEE